MLNVDGPHTGLHSVQSLARCKHPDSRTFGLSTTPSWNRRCRLPSITEAQSPPRRPLPDSLPTCNLWSPASPWRFSACVRSRGPSLWCKTSSVGTVPIGRGTWSLLGPIPTIEGAWHPSVLMWSFWWTYKRITKSWPERSWGIFFEWRKLFRMNSIARHHRLPDDISNSLGFHWLAAASSDSVCDVIRLPCVHHLLWPFIIMSVLLILFSLHSVLHRLLLQCACKWILQCPS